MKKRSRKPIKIIILVFLFAIFIANLPLQFVFAMENFPVVGNFVKVIAIRNYFSNQNNELDTTIPKIKYQEDIDAKINTEIEDFTSKIINHFYEEYEDLNHKSIKIDYEVVTNNESWFTLKLSALEESGSSNTYFKYYHIDKRKNEVVSLADLFQNEKYIRAITDNIKEQMKFRMEEDASITYWLNSEETNAYFKEISKNQNFYFNEKGNIVIVFDKYEVGPGSMGIQIFEIPKTIYQEYLK